MTPSWEEAKSTTQNEQIDEYEIPQDCIERWREEKYRQDAGFAETTERTR